MSRARRACARWLAAGFIELPFTPLYALAAGDSAPSATSAVSLMQVLLALLVVLAAIWAFAWFLRRFAPGQSGASGVLKVMGGVMVGPRERLVVVEVGDTWLLLGVASGHVSLVHSMPRPATPTAAAAGAANPAFTRVLTQALRRRRQS